MARALAALTIGPFDPSGRDGVVAGLKAFASLGLHGAATITSLPGTTLEPREVASQIDTAFAALRIDAVVFTCPANSALLGLIADTLVKHDVQKLVIDPAGAALDAAAVDVLRDRLLPLALIVVPNLTEAAALTGRPVDTWDAACEAAGALTALGAANAVIKGGEREGHLVTDLFFDGREYRDYTAERVQEPVPASTGATFAAALTATLAKDETVQHSVAAAKAYVTKALQSAYDLGGVPGLHHFYRYWQPSAR